MRGKNKNMNKRKINIIKIYLSLLCVFANCTNINAMKNNGNLSNIKTSNIKKGLERLQKFMKVEVATRRIQKIFNNHMDTNNSKYFPKASKNNIFAHCCNTKTNEKEDWDKMLNVINRDDNVLDDITNITNGKYNLKILERFNFSNRSTNVVDEDEDEDEGVDEKNNKDFGNITGNFADINDEIVGNKCDFSVGNWQSDKKYIKSLLAGLGSKKERDDEAIKKIFDPLCNKYESNNKISDLLRRLKKDLERMHGYDGHVDLEIFFSKDGNICFLAVTENKSKKYCLFLDITDCNNIRVYGKDSNIEQINKYRNAYKSNQGIYIKKNMVKTQKCTWCLNNINLAHKKKIK